MRLVSGREPLKLLDEISALEAQLNAKRLTSLVPMSGLSLDGEEIILADIGPIYKIRQLHLRRWVTPFTDYK